MLLQEYCVAVVDEEFDDGVGGGGREVGEEGGATGGC